jgi:hypothetical protein
MMNPIRAELRRTGPIPPPRSQYLQKTRVNAPPGVVEVEDLVSFFRCLQEARRVSRGPFCQVDGPIGRTALQAHRLRAGLTPLFE